MTGQAAWWGEQLSALKDARQLQKLQHLTTTADKMASLLVVIFVVELAVQIINNFGAAAINSLVRNAKGSTPTSHPKD